MVTEVAGDAGEGCGTLRPNPVTHRCGNEVVGGIIIKPNPWKKKGLTHRNHLTVSFLARACNVVLGMIMSVGLHIFDPDWILWPFPACAATSCCTADAKRMCPNDSGDPLTFPLTSGSSAGGPSSPGGPQSYCRGEAKQWFDSHFKVFMFF